MTTARKIKANRENARASTGPKSSRGKARAAQNARRHGLSVSILADPIRSAEVEKLAHEIAGKGASPDIIEYARHIAEVQINLVLIRKARHDLLVRKLGDANFAPRKSLRGFRKKRRRLRALIRLLGPTTPLPPDIVEELKIVPEGLRKVLFVLSDLAKELAAMDRYERRALSRRKFAIRDFDNARR